MPNEAKLKAYECSVDWDDRRGIVFAESPSKAKSAWEYTGDYSWIEVRVVRARRFDDIAGRFVTVQDCLDRGFIYECTVCGMRTSNLSETPTIVAFGKWPCCSKSCVDKVTADPLFKKGA